MRKKNAKRYSKKLKNAFKKGKFLKVDGVVLVYKSGVNSFISRKTNREFGKEVSMAFKGKLAGYKKFIRVVNVSFRREG